MKIRCFIIVWNLKLSVIKVFILKFKFLLDMEVIFSLFEYIWRRKGIKIDRSINYESCDMYMKKYYIILYLEMGYVEFIIGSFDLILGGILYIFVIVIN